MVKNVLLVLLGGFLFFVITLMQNPKYIVKGDLRQFELDCDVAMEFGGYYPGAYYDKYSIVCPSTNEELYSGIWVYNW